MWKSTGWWEMRKSSLSLAGFALLAIAGGAKADNVNLITNGGFETGNFSGWTLTGVPSYSLVAGFTAGADAPHSGKYYAMLGSFGSLSYLSQTVPTTVGADYDLTFYLASDGGTPSEFSATVGGTTLFDEVDPAKSGYVEYSLPYTATSDATTIQFGDRDDPGYLLLDDVSFVDPPSIPAAPVPLPSSLWLGSLAMLAMAGTSWMGRRAVRA
jgi:hypothetical protein